MRNPPWSSPSVFCSPLEAKAVEAKRRLLSDEQHRLHQAKSNFLIVASHALKSPLNRIQGYSAMLAEMSEAGRLAPEEARLMAKKIADGAQHLREIIEDVLDTTAIQVNALELLLKPLSLAEAIQLALRDLKQLIVERHSAIHVEGLDNLPKIEGDVVRLRQAFQNIIGYALECTPTSGEIRIAARLLRSPVAQAEPPTEAETCFVEIVVSGIGADLAVAEQERLGEQPYSGASDQNKKAGKGRASALRVAVARGIIECHGGRVWVESAGRFPVASLHILLPFKVARRCLLS